MATLRVERKRAHLAFGISLSYRARMRRQTTVFETMSRLAREHGAINLGQGFPDDPGPEDVRRFAAEALIDGPNQYPPMLGLPQLRGAVAQHYRHHHGIDLDAGNVIITSGATEALAATILALVRPGDEVVLFEPLYDAYLPLVRRAGGIPRLISLQPPFWRFDEAMLRASITPATRLVVLNTPLNPAGTLVPASDLALLAQVISGTNAIVLSDEVWEHVIFDGLGHTSVLAMEGLRQRSVKIGSAGKIFSLTGWKVGFICGPAALVEEIGRTHQFLTFTTPPNLQAAVAFGLGKADAYYSAMRAMYQRSRDRLATILAEAGFVVLPASATWFLSVDLRASGLLEDDDVFCTRLVCDHGVAAIPISAFFETGAVRHVVRFCHAKRDETLDAAAPRLAAARLSLSV